MLEMMRFSSAIGASGGQLIAFTLKQGSYMDKTISKSPIRPLKASVLFFVTLVIFMCAIPSNGQESAAEIQKMMERLFSIDGLKEWAISAAEDTLGDRNIYCIIFYSRLTGTCPEIASLLELQTEINRNKWPLIVLHPSHKARDIENLRSIFRLELPIISAPMEFEQRWDDIQEEFNVTINSFALTVNGDDSTEYFFLGSQTVKTYQKLVNDF